jgi:carbamoyltransferase
MRILGISAFYHDSAAALIEDGRIVAAAQEERFTRRKHEAGFPANAASYCLEAGAVAPAELDHVVFYDKPFLKFERLLETYLAFAPRGFRTFRMAMPLWLREKLFQKKLLCDELRRLDRDCDWERRLLFTEHHLSHAASAYYPSPFDEAVVLTIDGVGEWATTAVATGRGAKLDIIRELHFPHSLGMLYSAFTYYLGFKVNSGEYKVMGLAPYGEPRFASDILTNLIDLKPDGTFHLDQSYFDYCTGLTMTNDKFHALFGGSPRRPDGPLSQRDMDLAASIQAVAEEVIIRLTRALASETGCSNLCLAGGVALNCVANGKVLRDGRFERIFIQPAAGDAGGAIGAAFAAYHLHAGKPKQTNGGDTMSGAYLGPEFTSDEVERRLTAVGACFDVCDDECCVERAAIALDKGSAVGWFQGRMEFGPRALGARSILADPRNPAMQEALNLRVKYRESFRPFAPAVLREDLSDWFDIDVDSPYMQFVADVAKRRRRQLTDAEQSLSGIERLNVSRSDIPAVTHVDYSARIQTVHRDTNPRFHALLTAFKARTGCPVLINTSFNLRGEPIVCTPEEAFRCFMESDIEYLVVGNCVLSKHEQNPDLRTNYSASLEAD